MLRPKLPSPKMQKAIRKQYERLFKVSGEGLTDRDMLWAIMQTKKEDGAIEILKGDTNENHMGS